ncbi:phytanoyl-CoA dioxygenase family protein [Paenibacillus sacheonensis]|uniref:Phytanoyl-CoA dioxygenase n=1 Tax=Paenibacillus sacheonensis TaxID=742054 RepID=A0A7X5BZ53_9BACL|nr:phytanoyl-CoA dioxygenase family protein [Paenibacillus sacheonensis]MBM7565106.1 ectoine hydroxylase-related dioxygenase (phytanoyl-CoA dioxygenase family) [Paenibacillus sacheonensis]NBC70111.1 phytanoyl-CoA dioxygenase [Paenibacillus sacheonensis]
MDMHTMLKELGVEETTLSETEKRTLGEQGYIVFEELIGKEQLALLRDRYEDLMAKAAGTIAHQRENGTRRLFDLENQGPEFDAVYTMPKVLAAVAHLIGREFRFVTLNGRDAVPGEGLQHLHADWPSGPDGRQNAVTCLVMLDDFTPDNGATRVVPGTHRSGVNPAADWAADKARETHPDEVLVLAPAGSVAVMASHLWHGGTRNKTNGTRRALHPFYMGRDQKQSEGHLDARDYIRVKTYKRLSPAARYLLNVEWDSI